MSGDANRSTLRRHVTALDSRRCDVGGSDGQKFWEKATGFFDDNDDVTMIAIFAPQLLLEYTGTRREDGKPEMGNQATTHGKRLDT